MPTDDTTIYLHGTFAFASLATARDCGLDLEDLEPLTVTSTCGHIYRVVDSLLLDRAVFATAGEASDYIEKQLDGFGHAILVSVITQAMLASGWRMPSGRPNLYGGEIVDGVVPATEPWIGYACAGIVGPQLCDEVLRG